MIGQSERARAVDNNNNNFHLVENAVGQFAAPDLANLIN